MFPFPVKRTDLDNGLAVVSCPYPSPGVVSLYILVRTGSRNEVEKGVTGFAHFFEHMMFRGTPRYSEEAYSAVLKSLGADSNAYTNYDVTVYHETASADALETLMDLEADRFQHLAYSQADFRKEALAVLGEYNKCAASPHLPLEEKIAELAFKQHPYGHTVLGYLADIKAMPERYEYSLEFFRRWYQPSNCILYVVGDVRHDEQLVPLARKYFGGWKRGQDPGIVIPVEPPQAGEQRGAIAWPTETLAWTTLSYHVPAFAADNRVLRALDLLVEAYFSETSALYKRLVLEEKKVQSLSASLPKHRDPNLFTVMASVYANADVDAVNAAILRTLEDAAAQTLSAEQLQRAKSNRRYSFAMQLNSTDAVAGVMAEFLAAAGNLDAINVTFATLETITADEVRAAAAATFAAANRTAVTVMHRGEGAVADAAAATTASESSSTSSSSAPTAVAAVTAAPAAAAAADPLPPVAAAAPGLTAPSVLIGSADEPLIALRLLFRVGSVQDPPGKEGLTALTFEMLTAAGSQQLSYEAILDRLYPMAAQISSQVDKEVSVVCAEVHRDKLDELYDVLRGMLLRPAFAEKDFARVHQQQLNYLTKVMPNNDEDLGKQALEAAIYGGAAHPYGKPTAGTSTGLAAVTLADVRAHYQRVINAQALVVGAAGCSADFAARLVADLSSGLQQQQQAAAVVPLPVPRMPRNLELTFIKKETGSTAISLGFPIELTRRSDDFYRLAVFNSALGEHRTFNGRLMSRMRSQRGLNYGDYSYIETFIQEGWSTFPLANICRSQHAFSLWVRPVPNDKAGFALRLALRELTLGIENGLTQEEFDATRSFLLAYSKLYTQTLSRRLGYALDGLWYQRRAIADEFAALLPSLTLADVNAAAKRYLQAANLHVAFVCQEPEALRDLLLSGKPTPMTYESETPQAILDEDRIVEAFGLAINADATRILTVEDLVRS